MEVQKNRISKLWYLSIIFGFPFGGFVAYFINRKDDNVTAKNILKINLISLLLVSLWVTAYYMIN